MMAKNRMKGFTLVEMLLVLVIISAIIVMGIGYVKQKTLQMRIDRASLQIQQILNAGLSYYVAKGEWPIPAGMAVDITATATVNINNLQANGFLPSNVVIASPFTGQHYYMYTDLNGTLFTVYTSITAVSSAGAAAAANVVAGTLPLASTTATAPVPALIGTAPTLVVPPPIGTTPTCVPTDTTCWISASVNIPGQNLNNASAVNFTGLYKHGGCVPAPQCPVDSATGTTMQPQIMVVPVSVSGLNDPVTHNVYPISSFTAYAMPQGSGPVVNPPDCINPGNPVTYNPSNSCQAGNQQGNVPANPKYWRVCLQVVTQHGDVQLTNFGTGTPNFDFGNNVTLMAITRCTINNEPAGSKFSVYSN